LRSPTGRYTQGIKQPYLSSPPVQIVKNFQKPDAANKEMPCKKSGFSNSPPNTIRHGAMKGKKKRCR